MSSEKDLYAYLATEEVYHDNEYIIKEGTSGDWVCLILEGKVKVKKMTSKGLVSIATLKEGDIFGEMVFLQTGGGTRTASVIADGTVKVGVLETEFLRRDYEMLSPRLKSVMDSLIKRLHQATERAVILSVESKCG